MTEAAMENIRENDEIAPKVRKPRAKKPVVEAPPPPADPTPPAVADVVAPKRRARRKKDDGAMVPYEPPADLRQTDTAAVSLEPVHVAPPAETPPAPEGGDTHSFTEVKRKRGPYKPRKPKEEKTEYEGVGRRPPSVVDVSNPTFWMGLDQAVRSMRRQAKSQRFANFVIA